jgi:hypothetical protein
MRKSITPLVVSVLLISAVTLYGRGSLNVGQDQDQQTEQQNASPQQQQQNPQTSQPQASSSAAVQSVTGCLVKTDQGYSLKTDTDTYPIETGRDLSQYVNKRIKVTGILEHHNTTQPSTESSNAIAVTDLRLRVVASVVGDCPPASQPPSQ